MIILTFLIGIIFGIYLNKYCINHTRKNVYSIQRLFEYSKTIEAWINSVRNWFENHPN